MTAFADEIVDLSVKHLILAVFAFQRTVVEGNLERRLQTYLTEALLLIRKDPCLIANERMLESLAYHLVGAEQVGRGDTLTIRRVAHDDGLLRRLGEVLEVLLLDSDILAQTGGLHIQVGSVDSLDVYIIAIDMMLEFLLARIIIIYFLKEVGVKVWPLLECISLAEDPRRHVTCYEGSLDGESSRTAHGVYEISLAPPSRHQDHARGKHLIERSLNALLAVATTMKRLT